MSLPSDAFPALRRPSQTAITVDPVGARRSPDEPPTPSHFIARAIAPLTPAVHDDPAADLLEAVQFPRLSATPALSPIPSGQPSELLDEAQFKTPEGGAGRRRKLGGADVHFHIMEPAQENLLPPSSKLVVPANSPAASIGKNAEGRELPKPAVGEGQMLEVITPGELVALYANNHFAMPLRDDPQSPTESDQPRSASGFNPSMLDEIVSPPRNSKNAILARGQGLNFSSPSEPDIARSPASGLVEIEITERQASHQSPDAAPPAVDGPSQRRGCDRVTGLMSVVCLSTSGLLAWLASITPEEKYQAWYAALSGLVGVVGLGVGGASLPKRS